MTPTPARISSFTRDGLVFDIRDEGPIDGVPVVLLHGWPQDARSWDRVAPLLHARGLRTLAPDQRGASPGARPRWRWAYRSTQVDADVVALIERAGLGPVHLVGHDWGAAVAWSVAADRPDLVRTLAAVSVPHPAAFARAMLTSNQIVKSWYMFAFQLPVLPEWLIRTGGRVRRHLLASGMSAEAADRDLEPMRDRARARGGLHWYRAIPFRRPWRVASRVSVPTLHVWSDRDTALGPKGAALSSGYVDGPYRFEVLSGVSHWIPDEAPDQLDALLGEHFRQA
ncbi:alpha/beta fold hydrolase [Rhodococcus spelaei]|uniref:Alpha/beta fold hydrolase n=1 Tax=Rhodococcus spelaei TaxID=2546320 RepID=A0A541B084_9NOCA|nr:alpha/beta fold hydrolase [Rhodococcus spelaei]TQF65720.1 alpha/beta fold hydrolase [Rhodococcus spelaei]